jgi:hypothetical protein
MSLGALTTLAAVRDTRPPQKQDVGKQDAGKPEGQQQASLTDILVTQVPTELVAPYTAVTAAIVGAVGSPPNPLTQPDQLAGWRWLVFAILIVATVVLTWEGKRRKAGGGDFPLLEITGAVITATGWAFTLPGSPLDPYLHGSSKVIVPLIVAFAAIAAASMTASALQAPRNSAATPAASAAAATPAAAAAAAATPAAAAAAPPAAAPPPVHPPEKTDA